MITKGGLNAVTAESSNRVRKEGIRFNAGRPGVVDTGRTRMILRTLLGPYSQWDKSAASKESLTLFFTWRGSPSHRKVLHVDGALTWALVATKPFEHQMIDQ